MKKSVYIPIMVILILIIVIFCILIIKEKNKSQNTNANIELKSNLVTNEIANIMQTNTANTNVDNEIGNTLENKEEQNTQTSTETFEENPKTQEEKAIEIVKKDWNQTDNIKYSVDGIDENGKYIVSVRNSQTTKALAFYTVDVANNTFIKREMN